MQRREFLDARWYAMEDTRSPPMKIVRIFKYFISACSQLDSHRRKPSIKEPCLKLFPRDKMNTGILGGLDRAPLKAMCRNNKTDVRTDLVDYRAKCVDNLFGNGCAPLFALADNR